MSENSARSADERTLLLGFLKSQHDAVIWKVRDLTDDAARSVSTSTGLTLHGLIRHLEHVERWWISDVFAGKPDLPYAWTEQDEDGDLHVPETITMASLVEDYRREVAASEAIIAAHQLDDLSSRQGYSLRWILLHLVEEIARHLGHLDVLREQADGATGFGPPK